MAAATASKAETDAVIIVMKAVQLSFFVRKGERRTLRQRVATSDCDGDGDGADVRDNNIHGGKVVTAATSDWKASFKTRHDAEEEVNPCSVGKLLD